MGTRMAVLAGLAMVAIAGCGGSDDSAESSPITESAPITQSMATDTTEATTTTIKATTTTATTTTEATTTTTTTTIDPAIEIDLAALSMMQGLSDGTRPDLVEAFVSDLEPFPIDRVDVVSADVGATNIVVVATSGYATEEYQLDAAIDALSVIATAWGSDVLSGAGEIKVGLDLTIDGRRYVVPNGSMVAVDARSMSPQQALGLG